MMRPRFFDAFLAALLLVAGTVVVRGQAPDSSVGQYPRDTTTDAPLVKGDPRPIYFPPAPPALDQAVSTDTTTQGLMAPPELAAYVGEIYYPPLGARLARGTLTSKLRAAIARHRADKQALLDELRAELARLATETSAVRLPGLEALARRQAPRLAELDETAEELRRDLIQLDHGWDDMREWFLNGSESVEVGRGPGRGMSPRTIRRGFTPEEIAEVMRGAAYYYRALLPAQRRLLREIAIELTLAGDDRASATAAQPRVFFSPELARVALPDSLSPEAAAKLAIFQAKKTTLKKELYDAIFEQDRPGLSAYLLRTSRLKALASRQAAALADLEFTAEALRRELPAPVLVSRAGPTLPAALQAQVAATQRAMAALQQETSAKIAALAARDPEVQVNSQFTAAGLDYSVRSAGKGQNERGRAFEAHRVNAVEDGMAAIAAEHGRRYATLVNERNALKTQVARAIGTERPEIVEAALGNAWRAARLATATPALHDYRLAAFEPGLSVEQRRLLFDAAIEQLGLPLPGGELQPTKRD